MDRVFVLGGVWLCQQLVYSSVPLNVLLCVLLRPVMCFSSDVSAVSNWRSSNVPEFLLPHLLTCKPHRLDGPFRSTRPPPR